MNNLKLVVGEKFKGNRSGNVFEIVAINGEYAIIKDLGIGREVAYGLNALKCLAVTPVDHEEGPRGKKLQHTSPVGN